MDLKGRYLKALVNRPQCIGMNRGDYLLITENDNSNGGGVGKWGEYSCWCWSKYEIGRSWELMPEGFDPNQPQNPQYEIY